MKIYRWIDKYNERYCYKINRKFYQGKDSGKNNLYRFHSKFITYYIVRLATLFFGTFLLKRNILQEVGLAFTIKNSAFFNPDQHSKLSIFVKEMFLTILGYRHFVPNDILPLLKSKDILKKKLTFTEEGQPNISIIIPVYNQLAYTYNCLLSLKNNLPAGIPIEIIVIDDCSQDDTEEFFNHNVEGIRYIRNKTNQGFLKNCNSASEIAKGNLFYFLNNDTQVRPGWLNPLIEQFKDERIGCVGSKLIYAHGLLQEAGGIIFSDALGANYGRNDLRDRPRYNYIREVDYCSGASLMIRKADFDQLGQFDQQYAPAYYEDTDLCFAVRNQLGKKVVFHPLSEVIHFEGITSGKLAKKGSVKRFQDINKIKFEEKWASELPLHYADHRQEPANRRLLAKKRLIYIDTIIPEYDKNSGSFRAYQILKILNNLGYHITFIPADTRKTQPYYNQMVEIGIEVLFRYPNRAGMIKEINETIDSCDVIWISRPELNESYQWLIEKFPKAKWIYDTVDLHHIRLQRQAEQNNDKTLELNAAKVKLQELDIAKAATHTFTVTESEKVMLENEGIKNVTVIPNIHEPEIIKNELDFDEREGLLFIGAYDHPPNIDAAVWLVNEIMPEIWKKLPNLQLTLLGSKPTKEVLQLRSDLVKVPGFVRDVSEYFENQRVFVAPLRFGAGMKGKIGQSLAFKLPVITTDIGAEGMGLENGKNIIIANSKEEFIKQIFHLYQDQETWSKISKNCHKALKPYSVASVKDILKTIV
ncbi:glycosyltransferase [Echinicola sp. CAU 1574]|uniref:Glycosyltransferase n=1 Tax=Echinicola arenosa TaxID=2774144 RepID=A0ABR9AF44_9BACT|nr:glycosyltransferase [Echinicola arenosa]MBD8487297.1 glycosyltransferase [Echinicola arenosa]